MTAPRHPPARPRLTARRASRRAGFALVAVVWGLGLATLLGSAVMVGSRYRARDVDTLAAVARGGVAAESAVAFALRALMDGDHRMPPGRPFACTLPDGSVTTLLVTPESGKIDLNKAPLALLARLFVALTGEPRAGTDLAQAIVAFRTGAEPKPDGAPAATGQPEGPSHAPFATVLELDQVTGVTTDLLYRALPFVTVVSGKPDFDPAAASPALLALLGLAESRLPSTAQGQSTAPPAGALTIHAETRAPDDTWSVRDVLVGFGGGAPFTVREWRIGRRSEGERASRTAVPELCLP